MVVFILEVKTEWIHNIKYFFEQCRTAAGCHSFAAVSGLDGSTFAGKKHRDRQSQYFI